MVYRGYPETDSLSVVIKLLKNPYPSFSELLSFRNQYIIAKNINSSLIIQTYSLEPYQNGYALVIEDFGGISLKDYFTSDQTRHITFLQEFLRIAIADNGLGVPYTILTRLFDPFFTTKDVGKGSGLGLTISYQIVTELHQGKLDCNSTLGKGAEFVITLPIEGDNSTHLSGG